MGDHKRLALLILIMIGLCLVVGVTAIGVIYDAALGRERARLVNIAQSQARLMEAFARLEAAAPSEGGQAKESAVSQILEAHRRLREPVLGQTAELQLGRRDGNLIVFLTPARGTQQPHAPVAFGGDAAEAMSAALSGASGTMIGSDYAGRRVLAAFEPVPDLGLGLVAKIDMSEINEQYLRAAALAGIASLAAVAGAVLLFFRVGEPMIRRLTQSESRYRELFDNMDIGVAVYHAGSRNGEFVFEDFNRAGERIAQIDRRQLIGRSLTETFPGAGDIGLVDVLSRVWRTGKAERLPTRFYRDGRIEGWRDASVYRLPSGEIVTLFSDVSDRERQAEALRQSEERYRTLVEGQPDLICQFLPDTTLTFVNQAYAEFYGKKPEDLIGKRWLDFAAEGDRPRFLNELSSFTPENPERHEETRSTRADHEVRWYLCHHYGFFDESGKVVSFQTFATDITARKRAEEALRESERRARAQFEELETIYRTAPIGLALYDRDLNFVRVNSALAEINGLSDEEHLGRYVWDVVPHLREAVEPHLRKVLETGEPDAFEVSGETPKAPGVQRDWIAHYYPLKGSDGSVVAVGAIIQEITERKQSERALNEAVAQYKAMGEAVPYGVWLCGPDGGARYVSQSFLDLLDMTMEEVQQFGWTKRLPAEDVEPMQKGWLHCVRTGEPWESEHRIIAPDGEMRDVLTRGRPVRDRNGTITSWAGINLDITVRKRAEQARRESEARYRAAGEAIRYGVWVCNRKGGVEFVSQIFLDLVGKTLDEVRPRGWLDRLPPEDLKPTLEAWRECVRTGSEWKWEHKVRDRDGEYQTVLSLGRPVRDESGQISSWVGFNLDISERKRAEEALAQHVGLLTAITDSAADAIFVSDDQGRVTLINPAAEKIFGWSRHELTGQLLHEALHHHHLNGHPYPASECPLNCVYRTGETLLRHEDVFFRKGGSQVQVACSNAPLMIEGRIAGSVLVAHDITERKRSERALRESEARLRRTVENAPFPIMVHAENGEVVHVSEAWLTLTGYSREQIATVGAWTELAYRERKDMLRAEIDKLYLLDEAIDEGEYLIRAANGRTRVWAFSSAPLGKDGRGRRLVVSMAADITERKEAERALRESEIRMRALLDASQDEILLLSTEGRVLAINKAAERRLMRRTGGVSPIGAHLDRLLPLDQVESRMSIVRQVASTATLVHCDVSIRSRWFEFWFYPVMEINKPVSEVAVYAREITQQKKSQADLSKLFQAIQQSPMSVVITDRNGTIEYVNPEFTKTTGFTLTEAIGRNPRILKSDHTPLEQYEELWRTISSGGVWRGELLNKKKSGELFWELVSIAPIKDNEKIANFVAVKEDITHRKEMEDQLRQSQKMEALGQLTGGIAHDFNNLLAIIIGNLQLLDERLMDDPKAREMLADAIWSARRAGELTRRLLAFARRQPLKPDIIDLNEVIRNMTELLRRTLGAGFRVEESLAPDLWRSFADRGELERALVNLAVNSRDAMGSGGTLTLETRNAYLDEDYAELYEEVTAGEYVLVAVTDTGTGMPPEITERVFEPFFTTKQAGQGSGLGLSMVYGFVKQSGGHISVYSRVGQGTCVKTYLPRAPTTHGEKEKPESALGDGFEEKVILVVEDEPKLRKVAVKMLDRLGLRSMQAESAEDALEFLADTHIDVLFTDIELPGGMNGAELADIAHERYPNVKVLFTTGYASEVSLHRRGIREHAPWLLKPYSHLELARELKALLLPTLH